MWTLQSLRLFDSPAGRYTQIRTSPLDGRPTMVWNGLTGLRFSRCVDAACTNWTQPITLPVDPNPRFVRMEFAEGLPVIAYGAVNDTELHVTRCADQDCSRVQTRAIARSDKVRHPGLAVANGEVLIAAELYNSSQYPIGCSLSVLRVAPATLNVLGSKLFDSSMTPYIHAGALPVGGFEMPCLIDGGRHLAYWRAESRELVLVFDALTNATFLVVDSNRTASGANPGAWVRGIAADNGSVVLLSYWDLTSGWLKLVRCDVSAFRCAAPESLELDGQLDLSDFGAGAFPEWRHPPSGQGGPVLAFFSETLDAGELKLLACANPACSERELVTAASGKRGFGRDASIAFTPGWMFVTFLDLQGEDSVKRMVARIASFTLTRSEHTATAPHSHAAMALYGHTASSFRDARGDRDDLRGKLGAACDEDLDCQLNGVCVSQLCSCDPGWEGARCGQLSLGLSLPAVRHAAVPADGGAWTWGGSPMADDNGRWHLFFSSMVGGCGLLHYQTNSVVKHAVADSLAGPWNVSGTVLAPRPGGWDSGGIHGPSGALPGRIRCRLHASACVHGAPCVRGCVRGCMLRWRHIVAAP